MAQFGRPSTDTTNTDWQEDDGTTTTIFDQINESVASDVEFIRTILSPATNAVYVTKLTSITDPQVSVGHILRYRYRKDLDGGDPINLTVELRQGYVSEASLGTLITSVVHTNISGTGWVQNDLTLSDPEADTISNYGDLFVRLVGVKP